MENSRLAVGAQVPSPTPILPTTGSASTNECEAVRHIYIYIPYFKHMERKPTSADIIKSAIEGVQGVVLGNKQDAHYADRLYIERMLDTGGDTDGVVVTISPDAHYIITDLCEEDGPGYSAAYTVTLQVRVVYK